LYEETKWEKLKDRRNHHKLVLFYKMNYNKTPQYLAELIYGWEVVNHSMLLQLRAENIQNKD
jgi:hypothetical protein